MSMSFEDFRSFYEEREYLPNDVSRRKNTLNDKQLRSRYEKYLQSEQKKIERIERLSEKDYLWEELKSKLDLSSCQLYDKLVANNLNKQAEEMKENASLLFYQIDPAHVFGKGSYPHMKYDVDNVVPLNRYAHSMLDQNRDPVTGEQITAEIKAYWWKFIIGYKNYKALLERSRNGRTE